MNLREQILKTHSKENTNQIVAWIDNNDEHFEQLMQLFLHDEYRVVQRGAWALSECGLKHPQLIQKHIEAMLKKCSEENVHDAVKRNVLRLLQTVEIPENCEALALNLCFDLLIKPNEAVAVRAFSMGILSKLCQQYPELKNELKQVIENALEQEECSAGFKSKANRTLREISKIN